MSKSSNVLMEISTLIEIKFWQQQSSTLKTLTTWNTVKMEQFLFKNFSICNRKMNLKTLNCYLNVPKFKTACYKVDDFFCVLCSFFNIFMQWWKDNKYLKKKLFVPFLNIFFLSEEKNLLTWIYLKLKVLQSKSSSKKMNYLFQFLSFSKTKKLAFKIRLTTVTFKTNLEKIINFQMFYIK